MPTNDEQKLVKMMALANDPANNQNERDSALAHALKWAARKGLDIAQLESVQSGVHAMGKKIRFSNPNSKFKGRLYSIIANSYNCRGVIINAKNTVYHYFGYKSDLDWTDSLFDILWAHGVFELAHTDIPEYVHGKTFSHSFWLAYCVKIRQRLAEARNEAVSGTGAELVLVNRAKDAETALHDNYKHITRGAGIVANSASGWAAGTMAGERANLGRATIE
jgi:hypothetical protein